MQDGVIGPERGSYAADVRAIAERLDAGWTVFVALDDEGTRYNLVVARVQDIDSLGRDPGGVTDEYLFVAVQDHGAYWFNPTSLLTPDYVANKLNVSDTDGKVIGEFLTRLNAARQIKEVV